MRMIHAKMRELCALRCGLGTLVTCACVLSAAGCGESSGSGTMSTASDSAGIRIVELPADPGESARVLKADPDWLPDFVLEAGRLGDVEPLPGGGAVVLDEMSALISVLDSQGAVVVQFGGPGGGPGEFSAFGGISRMVVTDSSILVPDIQLQRITEFSLVGEVLSVRPVPEPSPDHGPVHAVDWRAHPESGLAFRILTPTGDLVLWEREDGLDTLHAFDLPDPVPNRLLPATALWDLDSDGRVLAGRSDRGRIEVRVPGEASPEWIARWSDDVRTVTDDERAHLGGLLVSSAEAQGMGSLPAEQRERVLKSVTFPESVPLVAGVLAGPGGQVWVQDAVAITDMGLEAMRVGSASGFGGNRWRVLGPDGLLQEMVALPRGFASRRVVEGCLYGLLQDELGVQRPARVCG